MWCLEWGQKLASDAEQFALKGMNALEHYGQNVYSVDTEQRVQAPFFLSQN